LCRARSNNLPNVNLIPTETHFFICRVTWAGAIFAHFLTWWRKSFPALARLIIISHSVLGLFIIRRRYFRNSFKCLITSFAFTHYNSLLITYSHSCSTSTSTPATAANGKSFTSLISLLCSWSDLARFRLKPRLYRDGNISGAENTSK
jgi:hypothetical protein